MNFDYARATDKNEECPCNHIFRDELLNIYPTYMKKEVDQYSFIRQFNWLKHASKKTPAGWFKVTKTAIIVEGEPFYYFETPDRKGVDYLIARQIEAVTWNRPK